MAVVCTLAPRCRHHRAHTYSDQACLWLQLGKDVWVKAGIEFDGQLMAGGVVTYPYSDWCVVSARVVGSRQSKS